jgi:hypothetical protein
MTLFSVAMYDVSVISWDSRWSVKRVQNFLNWSRKFVRQFVKAAKIRC